MKAKNLLAGLAIASLLLLGGSAFAEPNTIDAVPAATLLLPYFEVDLGNPSGVTTLFSINNASAASTIAHVTMWSDLSVPVLDWNVYLTGYDVHAINLRDVFNGDLVPATLHDALDTNDLVSPHGINPNWEIGSGDETFSTCDDQLPLGAGALNGTFQAYIANSFTGNPTTIPGTSGTVCLGVPRGNDIAIGYVTVDNAGECTLLFPGQAGYFGTTAVSNENQLWGDWFIVDQANAFAAGDNLVHIEYDAQYVDGDYTFYGRYVTFDATDGREPLANAWGTRYLNGGAFNGGTDLLVWRDAKQPINPFVCGTIPAPFPLNETQVIAFSETEDATELCFVPGGGNVSPPIGPNDVVCFPWETQRTPLADPANDAHPPYTFGWMYLNLDTTTGALVDPAAQSYITALHSALGQFQVGYQAIQLWNAGDGAAPLIVGNFD
ncbi:MAG: hypothetical protein DWQ36_16170 [Acidobacteria bacterium]|nr:MAG: hypothetical protein DWQ30_20575 [Acidobacteriota bacterium]REK05647.1 MAG: hypothetical protein DWQ36_16170 [Acidobacteriota bacterium]